MTENQIITIIKKRRSIRRFKNIPVQKNDLLTIIDAGRWAPSGLNNQPWRFSIIKNISVKKTLSMLTSYSGIIQDSFCCIAVFYHIPSGYNRDKDLMGIGACAQNMLLAAASLGIGSVWLGEILNRKIECNEMLGISDEYELMVLIAVGYPDETPKSSRMNLKSLMLQEN